jgi:hypothetical protein
MTSTQNPSISPVERRWILGVVAAACGLFLCSLTMADPDLWGHTLYGLRALEQGVAVERTDPFSYTAVDATWINHEWLTEWIYGLLWSRTGSPGLVLWRNLAVCLLLAVFLTAMRDPRTTLGGSVLLLVFTSLTLSDFLLFVRPQLATFVLFAVTLLLLRRNWDRPTASLWWCVPLMALWTNLHGGFLAGLAIAGLFALAAGVRWGRGRLGVSGNLDETSRDVDTSERTSDRDNGCHGSVSRAGQPIFDARLTEPWHAVRFLILFALMCAATLLNPYGPGLHAMLWEHLGTKQFVREWQPLWGVNQSIVYYVPFALAAFVFLRSRRWSWTDLAVTGVVAWQAASHLRHVALLAIAVAVLLPGPLSDAVHRTFTLISEQWSRRECRTVRTAATAVLVLLLAGVQWNSMSRLWRSGIGLWEIGVETRSAVPGMPVRAVAVMRAHGICGNLVTDYGWGQFVLWHLFPDCRVAFDGRYRTVYPAELEREFMDFHEAGERFPASTPILDAYPTEIALLPAEGGPDRYLAGREDWFCLYRDDQAALYLHREHFAERDVRQSPVQERVAADRWLRFPGEVNLGTRVASGSAGYDDSVSPEPFSGDGERSVDGIVRR